MRERDFPAFRALMDTVAKGYRLPPLEPGPMMLEFRALDAFSFEQVDAAVAAHKKDPANGRYCPTAAHLIAQIRGPQPDPGRARPDAYLPFEPEDRYALPALPLTDDEREAIAERNRAARKAAGERIKALGLRVSDIAKPFPQDRQREGANNAGAASSEPMVRVRADGTLEGKCSDGRWLPMEQRGGKS